MASGREPHAEKITVYLTEDELLSLEETKLALLRDGIKVDRGHIVRAAIEVGLRNDKAISRQLKKED